mmetsp:Transcript_34424/g.63468  ORF Transcript_34424/g.63468 Transcript_34424/m.63468 type:complete len:764 (+) Transcript_34424:91-2382(+)
MSVFSVLMLVLVASTNAEVPSSSGHFSSRSSNDSIRLPRGSLRNIRSAIETSQRISSSLPSLPPSLSSSSSITVPNTFSQSTAFRRRGGAVTTNMEASSGQTKPIRVCFQGEAGAYSEKSLRELLGPNVISVPRPNFESCYRAVANKECDYTLVPVENSLGGSIHENYDLMLRYDLKVVAEHDFRVRHCLLTKPGLDKSKIKYAISHPQALAQCDNYLRANGITPKPTYDTAGSAKMILASMNGEAFGKMLPEGCTPDNTAAIASDLAGETFGMDCKEQGIEDDDSNFTRFLLLGREGVVQYLNNKIPAKTSLVFTLPNVPGALFRSLACFSMRDIDFSKIESRPMSAALLNYLRFRNTITQMEAGQTSSAYGKDLPRFRYCFYLDILESELTVSCQNALHHLRERSEFCRVLGSYPASSRLVGPVRDAVNALDSANIGKKPSTDLRLASLPSDKEGDRQLNIGFVGYHSFGQYLSRQMSSQHKLRCIDPMDKSKDAEKNNVEYFPNFEMSKFLQGLDVVVITVPMTELEETMETLPLEKLRNKLVVEMSPLKVYPRTVLTNTLPADTDILCMNPMTTAELELDGVPIVYEKVRISDSLRADCFLSIFERARSQMVEMSAEDHDTYVANAEFVTHLTGRLLDRDLLPVTPVRSKEYSALCNVAEMTANDQFDMFYGMFKYNDQAKVMLNTMRENLARVERKIAAKEAYLSASAEMKNTDRQKLIAECRLLLREMARSETDSMKEAPTLKKDVPSGTSSTKKKD